MSTDTQNAAPSDSLDLEMDSPSMPRVPGLSPLANAIVAVRMARTTAELEQAIIPARSWPEGPDKAKLRAELRSRQDSLRIAKMSAPTPSASSTLPTIGQAPVYQGSALQAKVDAWHNAEVAKPEPTAMDILGTGEFHGVRGLGMWHNMWAGVAAGIAARPYQGMVGTAPTALPRAGSVAAGAVIGRIRTEAESRQSIPVVQVHPEGSRVADVDNAYNVRASVNREAVVIGAREGGSGVLTGWMGLGELTRPQIMAALRDAGLREDYAPPSQSAHAHAAAALTELTTQGRILRAERGRKVGAMGIGNFAGVPRNYGARWTVGNPTHGSVGQHMGEIVLTAALTTAGNLDLDGQPALVAQVRTEFHRRQANEVFPAGFVTEWLRRLLVSRFGAVRLGANWYIPSEHAASAERLCEAVSKVWGQAWILPALPVSTTDQLRAGLVRGLADEARVILDELEAQRAAAKRDNRSDIGPRSAATMLAKLRDVYDRSKGYAAMLGPDMVSALRGKLSEAVAVLEPLCDDTAQRFSMMDLA